MDGLDQVHTSGTTGTGASTTPSRRTSARATAGRSGPGRRRRSRGAHGTARRFVSALGALALLAGTLVSVPVLTAAPAQAAETNAVTVTLHAARSESHATPAVTKGDDVTSGFRYMINVDNSGKSAPAGGPQAGSGCSPQDPGYPNDCSWPSILEDPGAAPIYRQGTDADFGSAGLTLPDGDYLVTVLADGYKIDGAHFTVPMTEPTGGGPAVVDIGVQPDPLPDSTLRAQVFIDDASTNGAIDNGETDRAELVNTRFQGHINDTLGEVTTDVYGNPLCTTYVGEDPDTHMIPWTPASRDADGLPIVDTIGGKCFSDGTGMIAIPHLGTNRYTTTVTPPDGSGYLQTTTLEGNHDFDTWLMEGATGYDTEFAVAGEPVPTPQFGFIRPKNSMAAGTGSIKGVVVAAKQYYPPTGGSFNLYNGMTGSKLDKPIENPILSLNDLDNGDQAVWVGRGGTDGSFTIPNVPDGTYQLTWWDEPQNYILQLINVTVAGGETVDMKQLPMNGWWTEISGHVFLDDNKNGKRDPGEQGVAQFPLTLRKKDNSLMDRGSNAVGTDSTGFYDFEAGYPLAEWLILEAYSDSFYTTGVTYQADNQPTPTTIKGAGVDVSILPIIGLSGTVDWGVQKYDAAGTKGGPRNGGIVGSVSYDTTRNELDPQYAASEDWQPGVPNIPVTLYDTVDCPLDGVTPCDASETYALASDGSYKKGKPLNTYVSETWGRPTGCTARDVDGNPIPHPAGEDVLVPNQGTDGECLSALVNGVQIGSYATDQGKPEANFGAAVDGNYGFGDGCFTGTLDATDPANPTCTAPDGSDGFEPLPGAHAYLVQVDIPNDQSGNPMYTVTSEEDINIARGDTVVPQVPPPACAGSLHQVDVAGIDAAGRKPGEPGYAGDGYPVKTGTGSNGVPAGVTVAASSPVDNAPFTDMGGSPYEGMAKARCDTKLVELNNGKSIVPMFNVFTDVPIPSRLRGLIVDDLNFSVDKRTTLYGDKAGVPYAPVGIYDFTNRLVYTAQSDFNGFYDVLMPSTDHISCPTPSGVCTNLYRFVGNDPGVPGALNADYNPRFRTIATEFEAMPGVTIPTDLAPTQVGVSVGTPGTSPSTVSCPINPVQPQLFSVSKPFVRSNDTGPGRTITLNGLGFGATRGTGTVTLDGVALPETAYGPWNDTTIQLAVPAVGSGVTAGAHNLVITGSNGKKTVNGLTFHVLGTGYSPTVYEVGPGVATAKYDPTKSASNTGTAGVSHAIQNAIDDANAGNALIVVYPNTAVAVTNPRGAYYENLVVTKRVKLQGVGGGGFQGPNANSPYVRGTILDGGAFGGDTDLATDWFTKVDGLTWDGNQTVSDGAVIYLLAQQNAFPSNATFKPSIDGFDIRGGDQQGFPGNINDLTGQLTNLPPNIITQGGAVFANAYIRQLQVTNNVVENNGGGYGTIRIGTPDLAAPDTNQHNEGVRIANNRIVQNAGTNLSGAIGLFAGSDNYAVSGNDICGNFSLEYGAGVSVYGLSPNGSIDHNRITLNNSNDEGAGIMIAGQLPANPNTLSPGSGPVNIVANEIKGNLANDDGGGIRFLMSGNFPMNVHDNVIANNVSTHEGGGIAINDAPNVRIYGNTIMGNITTATAVTSNGLPAPAGVSTSTNSDQLRAAGASLYSNPLMFDNILWDNRAGTRAGTTVTGIGLAGDASPVDEWAVGNADNTGLLSPTNSVIQQNVAHQYVTNTNNRPTDPQVVEQYNVSVSFATWRQNPAFVDANVVTVEQPPDLMGDYHLKSCTTGSASPACNLGAASVGGVSMATTDIDGDTRPSSGGHEAGADEVPGTATPPPADPMFWFSTAGASNPPGVGGTADASDIYSWTGTGYARTLDLSAAPYRVPASAGLDGYARVDGNRFYATFSNDTTLPGIGAVQDEDVVYWNGSAWSVWFNGTAHGLTSSSLDVDAITVRSGILYFSTFGDRNPPGVSGTADDSDVYSWNGTTYARVWDASAHGVPTTARIDGFAVDTAGHGWASFSADTTLPGVGAVQDEDVVEWTGTATTTGTWKVWFNGTAHGLTSNNLDIDAFSIPGNAASPATASAATVTGTGVSIPRPGRPVR